MNSAAQNRLVLVDQLQLEKVAVEEGEGVMKKLWGGGLVLVLIATGLLALMFTGCGKGSDASNLEGYRMSGAQEKPLARILKKYGMFTAHQFDDDGSFRAILHLPNSDPFVKEGIYKTKNEETLINVPPKQVTTVNDVTLSPAALENVEVRAEGDNLVLEVAPPKNQETVLTRLSNGQYREMVKSGSAAS